MAQRDESKSLKIITIGLLSAEIYGEQVRGSKVAHFDESHGRKLFCKQR
jgi:hypothetical protein